MRYFYRWVKGKTSMYM